MLNIIPPFLVAFTHSNSFSFSLLFFIFLSISLYSHILNSLHVDILKAIYLIDLFVFFFLFFCVCFFLAIFIHCPPFGFVLVVDTNKLKINQETVANQASKSFTADITPLILASHKDNYEIIKILLDRGEQIPEPVR